jgi:hypothetical protein
MITYVINIYAGRLSRAQGFVIAGRKSLQDRFEL